MQVNPDFCHISVDKSTKDALVWHDSNWKFGQSAHQHKMGQLIYVQSGFQYLYTRERSYLLPQNHCVWIPSNCYHHSTSPKENVFLRTIFFVVNDPRDFYKEIQVFPAPTVLKEMILFTERYSRIETSDEIENAFLRGLFLSLPDMVESTIPLSIPITQEVKLRELLIYLFEHLDQTINFRKLAIEYGFSLRTLERNFQEELGLTPTSYLQMIRMIKAMELLTDGHKQIGEVAFQVGYNSLPTFSKTFKAVFGQSPKSYSYPHNTPEF
ncbi:AraC family transcriptional regulator [Flavobacterium sp. NKUCC04_CG]|uniref:AraC family transcriptional regulator n=1 Tax=Flavobacterium sp. NKUCC04_CG TaxID=2842121 RepID=UPI001C5AEFFF|nr:AraC family transcriptional regulator [Flavobacterium sp. NKUCC04_CG]MBW3519117.1 AraC family transcriptional regulator [Flavobacterium sp. NKUCC04_CG]